MEKFIGKLKKNVKETVVIACNLQVVSADSVLNE